MRGECEGENVGGESVRGGCGSGWFGVRRVQTQQPLSTSLVPRPHPLTRKRV